MDSKVKPAWPNKQTLSPKAWFWIRIAITATVVLVLWTLLAGSYVELSKSVVLGLVKAAGYYRQYEPKLSDALMSPAIPFVVLMIGTWGTKLIWKDGRFNWKLTAWTVIGTLFLVAISIYGQFLAFFSSVTGNTSDASTNIISFFIATMPVLVPIVLWTVLSYRELGNIFLKKVK